MSRLADRERFRFPLELELISPRIDNFLTIAPPFERPMIFYDDEDETVWEREMYRFGREPVEDRGIVDAESVLGLMDATGMLAANEAAAREAAELEAAEAEEEAEFADDEARSAALELARARAFSLREIERDPLGTGGRRLTSECLCFAGV